jgi:hypothetical protein
VIGDERGDVGLVVDDENPMNGTTPGICRQGLRQFTQSRYGVDVTVLSQF